MRKATSLPASFAARHGSPDKVTDDRFLEITCPQCGAILCVEASSASSPLEFPCAGCGILIVPERRHGSRFFLHAV